MVAGVTPGKGGQTHIGLPVFDTVPRPSTRDRRHRQRDLRAAAVRRGLDPGSDRRRESPLIVAITEGIPVLDMVRVKRALTGTQVAADRPQLPRRADARRMQDRHHAGQHLQEGLSRALFPRSGTLTYEAVFQTTNVGLGQTTAVGIGGDPVNGTNFIDVLELFLADDATKSIIMIGEIGGSAEEDAAQFITDEAKARRRKPMVGFIAGRTAPPGRRHGPRRRDRLGRPGRRRGQDRGDGSSRHPRRRLARASSARTLDALLKETCLTMGNEGRPSIRRFEAPRTARNAGPELADAPRWPLLDAASEDDLTQALDPTAMKLAVKQAAAKAGASWTSARDRAAPPGIRSAR